MKIRSVMQHAFSQVPRADIPRSSFDRSHGYKTTFDAGYLVPIFLDEALPGDTFNCKLTAFARFNTPLYPLMDNMFMDTFFFAVPMRLVWDNWQKFCGEQTDPGDSTDFVIPEVLDPAETGFDTGTIADYMGLPVGLTAGGLGASALPFRAYHLIYNEWFRDQNLQDSIVISKGNGPDAADTANIVPHRRGKRHDYFTSCLPWPQKGDSVELPLGTSATITGTAIPDPGSDAPTFMFTSSAPTQNPIRGATAVSGTSSLVHQPGTSVDGADLRWGDPNLILSGIADLSTATAATINQLRQAFQVQKLLERDARGGTRYTEILRAHFGVVSPDQRLQRPEYLGGGSSPVNITQVPQTSTSSSSDTPQGWMAAYGTVSLHGHGFTKSFVEHCIIIGLVSVRADLTYQQGLNRMWSRQTRYDFYWPALSHIGEQAVLSKEIYADGTAGDEDVFGYQERYAEYRYKPSLVTGILRSNTTDPGGSLDAWHLAQDFETRPLLNAAFIEENPPVDRVVAIPSEPAFNFDSYFQLRCARPMPMFGVPGLIDHF